MRTDVDLRGLAIDRGGTDRPRAAVRRHLLTRYVLPLGLIAGFLALVAWASWDVVLPPREVTVVPVVATTAEARREGTPLFKAAGWVEPRPTPVRVAALAPGVVEALLVVEDQPVKAGQAIAELVKDDARLARDRAAADLKLREAELDEARSLLRAAETRLARPVHLEATLGEAEAALARIDTQLTNLPFEVRRAEADREAARKDYDASVASRSVVPGVQIDIARSKLDSAAALVEELRRREESLRKERAALARRREALGAQLQLLAEETRARDEARAKVKAAEARVEQARIAFAEAELRLERMTIRSPIDGRVYRLIGHPGARVGGGVTGTADHDASTVVTLYRPEMLQARVDVRFEDIPRVRLDQPVTIENPALPSPLAGKVLFISSEANIQKNTLEVKVEITDPSVVFKPEMLVDVTFLAPRQSERGTEPSGELKLYVPGQLVHRGESGPFVWLADQSSGVARRAPVQTGAAGADGLVEITAGLTASGRVISGGSEGLRDGDRIRVAGEDTVVGGGSHKMERLSPGGHH